MGIPGINKQGSKAFAVAVLVSALSISAVAAYYSIVGLMAIFSGAAVAIAVMGAVLELGKLVAASWLYNNWKQVPFLMKTYMSTGVVVLMFITSMGIFGFLSKAHLEQVGPTGNHQAKVEKYEFDIKQQEKRIERAEHILSQFDAALEAYFELEYVTRGLKERKKQTAERVELQQEIEAANFKIDELSELKFSEQKELRGIEAEVGPIKYIAELVYGANLGAQDLDKAVRWMIILLIFVFDPMAVLLVIAGNMSLSQANKKGEEEAPPALKNPGVITQSPPPPPSSSANFKESTLNSSRDQAIESKEPKKPEETAPRSTAGRSFDQLVEETCSAAGVPFNFDGPDGSQFKARLIKALKKSRG